MVLCRNDSQCQPFIAFALTKSTKSFFFFLSLSRVGRRHCARVAAAQRRRPVVIIAAKLSSVSKLATQDFVNFFVRESLGSATALRLGCCARAAALHALHRWRSPARELARHSGKDVRFFSSCKAVCSIACSVLSSLHDAFDVCFS